LAITWKLPDRICAGFKAVPLNFSKWKDQINHRVSKTGNMEAATPMIERRNARMGRYGNNYDQRKGEKASFDRKSLLGCRARGLFNSSRQERFHAGFVTKCRGEVTF